MSRSTEDVNEVRAKIMQRAEMLRNKWVKRGGRYKYQPTVRMTHDEMMSLGGLLPRCCGLPMAIDVEPEAECPDCGGRVTLAKILREPGTSTRTAMCPHCKVGSPAREWKWVAQ